jgi:hypothetical protein
MREPTGTGPVTRLVLQIGTLPIREQPQLGFVGLGKSFPGPGGGVLRSGGTSLRLCEGRGSSVDALKRRPSKTLGVPPTVMTGRLQVRFIHGAAHTRKYPPDAVRSLAGTRPC